MENVRRMAVNVRPAQQLEISTAIPLQSSDTSKTNAHRVGLSKLRAKGPADAWLLVRLTLHISIGKVARLPSTPCVSAHMLVLCMCMTHSHIDPWQMVVYTKSKLSIDA